MPTCTIVIRNHSKSNEQYLLFSAPPKKDISLGTVWSNVWGKTGGTATLNCSKKLVIAQDDFGICGTTPEPLDPGVSVTKTDWAGPVQLTTSSQDRTKYNAGITNGTPGFDSPVGQTSKANLFGIKIELFDPNECPNTQIGMGKYDTFGNVVPAFVFTPNPDSSYDITPIATYYVATGSFSPGAEVDITTYGIKVEIDFTTATPGFTQATVIHEIDGSWRGPIFGPPEEQVRV